MAYKQVINEKWCRDYCHRSDYDNMWIDIVLCGSE